jgi:hypothetical protein
MLSNTRTFSVCFAIGLSITPTCRSEETLLDLKKRTDSAIQNLFESGKKEGGPESTVVFFWGYFGLGRDQLAG